MGRKVRIGSVTFYPIPNRILNCPFFPLCSGAGIGWMGSLDGLTSPAEQSTTDTSPDLDGNSEFLISPPISDYVQSLLNANQQAQISLNDTTVLASSQPLTEIIATPLNSTKRSSLIVKTPFKLSDSPPPPKNC